MPNESKTSLKSESHQQLMRWSTPLQTLVQNEGWKMDGMIYDHVRDMMISVRPPNKGPIHETNLYSVYLERIVFSTDEKGLDDWITRLQYDVYYRPTSVIPYEPYTAAELMPLVTKDGIKPRFEVVNFERAEFLNKAEFKYVRFTISLNETPYTRDSDPPVQHDETLVARAIYRVLRKLMGCTKAPEDGDFSGFGRELKRAREKEAEPAGVKRPCLIPPPLFRTVPTGATKFQLPDTSGARVPNFAVVRSTTKGPAPSYVIREVPPPLIKREPVPAAPAVVHTPPVIRKARVPPPPIKQEPGVVRKDFVPPPPIKQEPGVVRKDFVPPPVIKRDTFVPPPVIKRDTSVPPPVIKRDTSVPPPVIKRGSSVPPPVIKRDTSVPPPAIKRDTSVPPPAIKKAP